MCPACARETHCPGAWRAVLLRSMYDAECSGVSPRLTLLASPRVGRSRQPDSLKGSRPLRSREVTARGTLSPARRLLACVGLCCVALTLTASADFAIDKPAGEPCPNLEPDFRCGIHSQLRDARLPGLHRVRLLRRRPEGHPADASAAEDWRQAPDSRRADVRGVRGDAAAARAALVPDRGAGARRAARCRGDSRALLDETERLTGGPPETLAGPRRRRAPRRGSTSCCSGPATLVRAGVRRTPMNRRGRGPDRRGAARRRPARRGPAQRLPDRRGPARRRPAAADLIGADLRDADLRGAKLARELFLTQMQVNAAQGDAGTTLPSRLVRPPHWS